MNFKKPKEFTEDFMIYLKEKNPRQPEFHQAVQGVIESLADYVVKNPRLIQEKILERMVVPEGCSGGY